MSNILVTGGAGYIGSHTLIQLIEHGYSPVVFDSLVNASILALERVEQITETTIPFVQGDIRDENSLRALFEQYEFQSVIHFAGLKAVGESVANPIMYYENNVFGSMQLFKIMSEYQVRNIVFSSSATVYGDPVSLPLHEAMPTGVPTNPYGMSKLMIENILKDLHVSDNDWRIVNLRYFNPVGAHSSGLIGEDPNGIPNNLMPFIAQTATGLRQELSVFGNDYDTHDGTGVRDYIHVVDLAFGHIQALKKIESERGVWTVNLGTGMGYSVLDMVKAFEQASGKMVPYVIVDRRPGDVAACYADPSYAKKVLNWEAKRDLNDMCRDTWNWQSKNPQGFNSMDQKP
ncbi:UDP-glucose 4-epimerase GalE [Alteromonas sp. LMIT006]|uniref:UDP-glucose 4-epimerase GalE n=1 Tax=Alteromonadaceae TaxID=72275 RepID=UPI0020CA6785|nr:UDP-glucose 4-epimerase GalE [Alteromonas sp. LMIT006]UTP71926.1 UDP-glucose 4-epimerase GalE [Alteromonas sp. LMIT006]